MTITLRPRDIIVGGIVAVVVIVVFALGIARVIEAQHARTLLVIECVTQMRTAESLPQVLWDADDFHAAALVWCDDFVERSGRPEDKEHPF